ncbi:hypothetical protein BBK82_08405 [Lentzea guizhouensis]|uniref:Amidohydrolase-related domain-containing protein n=1 Tax=Lentzea guizhouensis TaxID=1586287 RepID=A0A1B2HEE3_9PSEU|nr:hypothetical protein [Lentzea guizhouensis]ANZ36087.1 hypothetical protein BBK82_08405 [Lentzea guizhouensis]
MALVDVHSLGEEWDVLDEVWASFDRVRESGVDWSVHHRTDENARLTALRELGVSAFAPLVYPHRPGVAEWLNEWVPLPAGWRSRIAGLADRVVLGSDFPNIPHPCEEQLAAIRSWGLDAAAEQAVLHANGVRLLQLTQLSK